MWERIAPVLAELDPPKRTGRPRSDARAALAAILYRRRSGVPWNHLPAEFPRDSAVQRTCQRWIARGVFDRLGATLGSACAALGGGDGDWQAADGAMGTARLGGTPLAPPHPLAARMA